MSEPRPGDRVRSGAGGDYRYGRVIRVDTVDDVDMHGNTIRRGGVLVDWSGYEVAAENAAAATGAGIPGEGPPA